MALQSIVDMANSSSLLARAAACAAQLGENQPMQWAQTYAWKLAVTTGWADKWDAAKAAAEPPVDMGADPDVISDADILAAVQALRTPATSDTTTSTADKAS